LLLGSAKITAFVPTRDGEKARAFYVDTLGLRFVSDDRFALVLDANGTTVRVSKAPEFTPQKFTVLGWEVSNIERLVSDLQAKGVTFENYGFPGQDERGIWTAPFVDNATSGARVAWFKDPDGNVLSITQLG
jgi:catechol 2,3-dioxygenase-like lactoylglutathione lyase family enzyme